MAATRGQEVVITRGSGSRVWDAEGNEYLDGTAALWFCAVGHGRPEIAEAVAAQMASIAAFHTFDVFANEPAIKLSDRLSELSPFDDAGVFLTPGGGSDAIETACKLARRYWSASGQPEKRLLVHRQHAYHGMNGFGTSLGGIAGNADGLGQLIPGVAGVAWDSVEQVEALFAASSDQIAAFIGEPVIGSGGVHIAPPGYWEAISDLCERYAVLLIADEVISGFGRLGGWFASPRLGLRPDIICCAKGLTSGYLPLGAVIASPRVKAPFWDADDAPVWRHGYTYEGHPVACAAALANLDIIERENLLDRVTELEPRFASIVREALQDSPLVGDIRTIGLLAGVVVDASLLADHPGLPQRISATARAGGLISRGLGQALQLSPPLTTSESELREMATRLRTAFDAIEAELAPLASASPRTV